MLSGFDMNKLQQEAQIRWLKPIEVLFILQNHEKFKITHRAPGKPPSGSLFLFNRRVLRYFRNDGHLWRKKKNGKSVAEAHERLKVDNVDVLSCYYAHGETDPCFQRRSYWMLDPAYDHIALVQYREVREGKYFPGPSFSTPNQNTSVNNEQGLGYLTRTSELTELCQSSCSPGSLEEVSSQFVTREEYTEALRKLEIQLSLDDDDNDENEVGQPPSYCSQNEPNNLAPTLDYLFDELIRKENDHVEETRTEITDCGSSMVEMRKNSDMWTDLNRPETAFGAVSNFIMAQKQCFMIREISPEWAFSLETTKVIITGDFLCNPSEYPWAVLFDNVEVPLEIVQNGVIRCQTPWHVAGKVSLCITAGNRDCCSEIREFEFRENPDASNYASTINQSESVKSNEELLLLRQFVQILLGGPVGASISKSDDGSEFDLLRYLKGTEVELAPEKGIDWIVQELLKDKFRQWLSSKHQEYTEDHLLSKSDKCIIHIISGLGYDWALNPVLNSGVGINYRDANGWTALHWAAYFGREKMVATLLAAGASPGAVTDPSSLDPDGRTPASVAAANGHTGLAGYLSEAALTNHLFSLPKEQSETYMGSSVAPTEIDGVVDRISQRRAHLHGGTVEQLSLKDSLAAIRNAAQAAARIQVAFRAYSFRKQQSESLHDVYQLSSAIKSQRASSGFSDVKFDKAALSIQKNYLRWKRHQEFLSLRKHVVKIQTHVRAHQARKKYKDFLQTVGVLEKLILRWRRGGVGLRGFQAEAEPIDEEEKDILKVFRKKKVDAVVDQAVSRVLSMVDCPEARQQYRRMLERYQQAETDLGKPDL
ncbi:calmodulin-binding transcription activator 4-like isoform X1 [Typha latifolia]|uniref:calmodulin-binding transcription activator 4-like isoform X1 n=1 Tax=Typha latifolia TaxID=4733 RepID=UPI003C2CAEE4